tara:strand:- start:830 stop:1342 length:513 start_codon:yes stop_codon:yes gene_type:complete
MRVIKVIVLLLCLFVQESKAQKTNVMLSYGQSKFIRSPGLEASIYISPKLGIEFGLSTYFLDYRPQQLVNISDNYFFNIYNVNIGLCGRLLNYEKIKVEYTVGVKVYYGPEFEPLHFFKSKGYYIYYDASELRPDLGIDMGLLVPINKYIAGLKYDTARNKLRLLVGMWF